MSKTQAKKGNQEVIPLIPKSVMTSIGAPRNKVQSTQKAAFLHDLGVASFYAPAASTNRLLWRGQSNQYRVSPAAHTRLGLKMDGGEIIGTTEPFTDADVVAYTEELLHRARKFMVDSQAAHLPDMALLALLQHNLIATPLLDVSADPLLSLTMALDGDKPATKKTTTADEDAGGGEARSDDLGGAAAEADQEKGEAKKRNRAQPRETKSDAALIVLQQPPAERRITQWEARPFEEVYAEVVAGGGYWHYAAPYVTDRLRVQRGTFLLGPVVSVADDPTSSIGLNIEKNTGFGQVVGKARENVPGRRPVLVDKPTAINIPGILRESLREWVREAAQLDLRYVNPTPLDGRLGADFIESNQRLSPRVGRSVAGADRAGQSRSMNREVPADVSRQGLHCFCGSGPESNAD